MSNIFVVLKAFFKIKKAKDLKIEVSLAIKSFGANYQLTSTNFDAIIAAFFWDTKINSLWLHLQLSHNETNTGLPSKSLRLLSPDQC